MSKTVSLVGSDIKAVYIERDADGSVSITTVGVASDGVEDWDVLNLVQDWVDLPVSVQNTGDNFLKHLSREFNKHAANEDSDTWVSP